MKAYVITTGSLFGLLTIVHMARLAQEGAHVMTDPWFVGATLAGAIMATWSWLVLQQSKRS